MKKIHLYAVMSGCLNCCHLWCKCVRKEQPYQAIRACVGMIFSSHNYNENTIFAFTPFKFGGIGKPSTFFIRFLLDGIEYEYSFELNKVEILKEALYYYPNGRRSLVFSRDETKGPDKKNI